MTEVPSRVRVLVDRDLGDNPWCIHGPKLRFTKEQRDGKRIEFFGCSAFRNPSECPGSAELDRLGEKEYHDRNLRDHLRTYQGQIEMESPKFYCAPCNSMTPDPSAHSHSGSGDIIQVTEDEIAHPTEILKPNSRDKKEAQYFFHQKTVDQILDILRDIKCNKTLCIGTPRLHEQIRGSSDFSSILLDFDQRLAHFYSPDEFLYYNMFNHYFFCGSHSKGVFDKFLKNEKRSKACLLVDPPFGCRAEALAFTIKRIQMEYLAVNKEILPVFWIFPYFMENYVVQSMPEMTMLDFKVNYTNHRTYNDSGRFGSPVRIFTNVLPKMVKLSGNGYRFCGKCQMYRRQENIHCDKCQTCPSKNGSVYKHCPQCLTCVKPYYVHCPNCNRCAQADHKCSEYQENAFCWVCDEKGHVEKNCPLIKKSNKKTKVSNKDRVCVICRKANHNERQCRAKDALLSTRDSR